MKESSVLKFYTWLIVLLGAGFLALDIRFLLGEYSVSFLPLVQVTVLFLLVVLCRIFPIEIAKDKHMDISFIPVLASAIALGPELAALLFALSPLLLWQQNGDKKWIYPLRHYPLKELFNTANIVISVFVGGHLLHVIGGYGPDLSIPYSLFPACVFAVVTLLCNILIFTLYFLIGGQGNFYQIFLGGLAGVVPSMLSTIPFGLLIALLLHQPNGYFFLLLFLLPLLLARYSFKLYLDSKSMHIRTISALSRAIEAKDAYTQGHSQRVAALSVLLAHAMGCRNSQVEQIRMAALLHDVGKIGIDDGILQKPASLTADEFSSIKQHPVLGEQIIREIRLPAEVNQAVLYHHRYFDGSGYPVEGPAGKDLPLGARIITVADAYDAMTSVRPYRKGMDHQYACDVLHQEAGRQFDPDVIKAFDTVAEQVPQLMDDVNREVTS